MIQKPLYKISFIDNITKNIEIYISPEKTMGDLFIIYHKKRNDAKKKTFLGNGGKIDFENQKNMIIKDYIKNDSEMSIIVVDMSPS